MTISRDALARIGSLATTLATLQPKSEDQVALLAFMAGAIYSLRQAVGYKFDDARMAPSFPMIAAEVQVTLTALTSLGPPPTPWLSGYYVDSAMMRLAAIDERLGKLSGKKHILPSGRVSHAVNALKHDIDAGVRQGWQVRFSDLLEGAEALTRELAAYISNNSWTAA